MQCRVRRLAHRWVETVGAGAKGQLAKEADWVACRPFGRLRVGCSHPDFGQGRRQSALAPMAAED